MGIIVVISWAKIIIQENFPSFRYFEPSFLFDCFFLKGSDLITGPGFTTGLDFATGPVLCPFNRHVAYLPPCLLLGPSVCRRRWRGGGEQGGLGQRFFTCAQCFHGPLLVPKVGDETHPISGPMNAQPQGVSLLGYTVREFSNTSQPYSPEL